MCWLQRASGNGSDMFSGKGMTDGNVAPGGAVGPRATRPVVLHLISLPLGAASIVVLIEWGIDDDVAAFLGASLAGLLIALNDALETRKPSTASSLAAAYKNPFFTIVHVVIALQIIQNLLGWVVQLTLRSMLSPELAVEAAHRLVLLISIPVMVPLVTLFAHRLGHSLTVLSTAMALLINFGVTWGVGRLLARYVPESAHFAGGEVLSQTSELLISLAIGSAIGLIFAHQAHVLEQDTSPTGEPGHAPMHSVADQGTLLDTVRKAPLYAIGIGLLVAALIIMGKVQSETDRGPVTTVHELLETHIPEDIRGTCTDVLTHDPEAFLATKECSAPDGITVRYSLAHSGTGMREHYEEDMDRADVPPNSGNCSIGIAGEAPWWRIGAFEHTLDQQVSDEGERHQGRMFCSSDEDDDTATIGWMDFRVKIFASATLASDDVRTLYDFWSRDAGPADPESLGGEGGGPTHME
jgi:hypothetical protein